MTTRSIRTRLLLGAGFAIFLALILAGLGLSLLFQRHIERREALSLQAKALELLPALTLDPAGRPRADREPSDGRFARPASGLYWQASTGNGILRSASLWDQRLPVPVDVSGAKWAFRKAHGPFDHDLFVIARAIRPDASGRSIVVQFASNYDTSMISIREFRREATLALLLLWIMLMAAVAVQIRLGLHPLRHVQRELEALRHSPGARLSADHPQEVAPLVTAINALADVRAADLERARHRAADLAHSLKTPLAAMAAQSRRAREQGAIEAADALDRTIAAARNVLETELARAKGALARDQGASRTQLLPVLEAVIAVLERTEAGGQIVFAGHVPATFHVPVPTPELTEMLGALLENAVGHARRTVTIDAVQADDMLEVRIRDDGPGMDPADIARATERGRRLDETGPGHGLGLAIVRELAGATGGTLALGPASGGGLVVTLGWLVGSSQEAMASRA